MSRSGYSENYDDQLQLGRWRGQVASATRGKRGQRFFADLVAALDAMPDKRLVRGELETPEGAVCALGALGKYRGVAVGGLDTYDHDALSAALDVAEQLTREVMYENDESWSSPGADDSIQRWQHVRDWAVKQLTGKP